MTNLTKEEIECMTEERAKSEISNAVYAACGLFERLEGQSKVRGNGHQMAQEIAELAQDLISSRWID